MSAFQRTDIVLVTGANGHVGSHLCLQLLALQDGPRVRACTRSANSAKPIEQAFSAHLASGRLTFTHVPDITQPGAFDAALENVTHVAHVASPIVLDPQDVERDLLQPAIRGTTSLLESAKSVPSIRAIVVTSSFAAVFNPFKGWDSSYRYSTKDWSPLNYEQAAGREATDGIDPRYEGFKLYLGSKKHSEEQAWKVYAEAQKAGVAWTLTTVLPTYIGGPCCVSLKGADGTDGYSFSQKIIADIAREGGNAGRSDDFPFWIDVRDVARAHVEALRRPQAAGKRWLLALGKVLYGDIAESIAKQFPQLDVRATKDSSRSYGLDADEALAGLGLGHWISLDDMVRDTLAPIFEGLEK